MASQQLTAQKGSIAEALRAKISARTAHVAVIGLGYVGLPFAVEKAKVGFPVLGFDINPERCTWSTEEKTI